MQNTKHYFLVLDGLRGIAALAIVIFHFMENIESDPSMKFIGHGFLVVDFFFCLSGFVNAYAYDDRIGKMGLLGFSYPQVPEPKIYTTINRAGSTFIVGY